MIKFIIMGQPRGGSTAMRTAVASHSQVYCEHEILHHRLEARQPNSGAKGYSELNYGEAQCLLEKLMASGQHKDCVGFHYNFEDNNKHNDLVSSWADKIVVVDRKNQYDRWKSFYFAVVYNQWHDWIGQDHNPNKSQPPEKITLSQAEINKAVEFVKKNKKTRQCMLDWAQGGCFIDYESLCQNPIEELKSVLDYLGLPQEDIAPKTKRFSPRFFANESKVQQAIAFSSLDDLPVT